MAAIAKNGGSRAPSAVVAETSTLPIGSILKSPLYDSERVLLLNAGSTITAIIKQRLIDRQIERVVLSGDDYTSMFGGSTEFRRGVNAVLSASDSHYEAVASSVAALGRSSGVPLKNQMIPMGKKPYDRHAAQRLALQFARNTKSVELMMRKVVQGAAGDASILTGVVQDFVGEMGQDLDHVLASSGNAADTRELVQRSLRMSLLGIAVGIEMGLDEPSVCELGVCGIVQDWGLFCLPERLRKPSEPFNEYDWELYMRHPSLTFDALATVGNLSPAVRFAASQVHEMCDGSGYPRGLTAHRIHQYARILGPVDAYLALVEPRRGRPAVVPHDAVSCLLHQIPMGRFDGVVVRSLLSVLSLFPLGSRVRLSNGQHATVIRRGATDFAKPIVQYLVVNGSDAPEDDEFSRIIIDLQESQLEIDDVLLEPGKLEMRLERSVMYDVAWDGPDA